MRLSPHRHTLAVLRTFLGLTQKEMAELAECSRPTIQAVELGKLKLSFDLADRIHFSTGISTDWLLANEVTKPPLANDGKPYTKATFDERRATLYAPAPSDADACWDLWDVWSMFSRHVRVICVLYSEAYKKDRVGITAYKTLLPTVGVLKDLTKADEAVIGKAMVGAGREIDPERLDEVFDMVHEFAAETYEELKRKLKKGKQPLSPAARAFVRDYDKKFARAAKK